MKHQYPSGGRTRTAGFTLIELMIAIVIATVLITIAVPTYQAQIRKSRRTEARMAVLDLASREERFLSTANSYSQDTGRCGIYGPVSRHDREQLLHAHRCGAGGCPRRLPL